QNNDNDQAPENTQGTTAQPDSIGPPESAAAPAAATEQGAAPKHAPASEPASTQARGAFDVRTKRTGDAQNKKSLYLSLA
ncbi:Conjugal transfer protein, partial [Pseudomonas savastanoi pv. nerii]